MGALLALGWQAPRPSEGLAAGTILEYSASGGNSRWVVDSVAAVSDPGCGRVWLRREATPEHRHDCVRGEVLERWNDGSGRWVEVRPVTPGSRRRYRRGATEVEFVAERAGVDTVGGMPVPIVVTTVTTYDSTGTARRRLREHYSIGLTTATWGIFESADPTSASGWTTQQEFRLVAIRR